VALPASCTYVRRFSALQGLEVQGAHALFDLWLLPAGAGPSDAAPLEVIYKERLLAWPVPPRISGTDTWEHPVTSSVVFHVRHWLHVLQVNLLSIQVRWVDEVVAHPLWGVSLLARAAIGRGRYVWRVGAAARRYGRDVDVHPTARVEGSFLGDGVRVGPHALVRGAIIGAGTVIEQAADVSYSVLGERCFVSKHSLLWAIVAHDRAELCMKGMQMCLVGRGAALTARATPLDVMPGRPIRVRDGASFVEVDVPVLGACFGHDTFVGADVYTGPGREIPNGVRIAPDPARVLSRVPASLDPARVYAVRDGTLVAIDGDGAGRS
jgi:acetyltransferase-like isoleucine patch superfamily enzyme